MSAKYETGCERLIFDKTAFAESFFILSSGLAGEILQKFVNYRLKAAIVGDYSHYTSKPLHDVCDRDLACGLGDRIAPVLAGIGMNNPSTYHPVKDLLKIRCRYAEIFTESRAFERLMIFFQLKHGFHP